MILQYYKMYDTIQYDEVAVGQFVVAFAVAFCYRSSLIGWYKLCSCVLHFASVRPLVGRNKGVSIETM
jgi:hypothetical protein